MAVGSSGFIHLGVMVVEKTANEQLYLSKGEKRTVFKKISAPKGLVLETKLTEKIFFSAIFRLPDVKRAQKIVLTFSNQFTINPLTAVVAILRHKSEGGGTFRFSVISPLILIVGR